MRYLIERKDGEAWVFRRTDGRTSSVAVDETLLPSGKVRGPTKEQALALAQLFFPGVEVRIRPYKEVMAEASDGG